jgi:hypothetical protein
LAGAICNLFGIKIAIGNASKTTNLDIQASTMAKITSPRTQVGNGGVLQAVKLADGSNSTTLFAQ